jgi:hypothetical protein
MINVNERLPLPRMVAAPFFGRTGASGSATIGVARTTWRLNKVLNGDVPKIRPNPAKDCHGDMREQIERAQSTIRPTSGFFAHEQGERMVPRGRLSRWFDHRLAKLVHQGSDPTLPHQALVIRESVKLWLGFWNPSGHKTFSARCRHPVQSASCSPDVPDCIPGAPSRASTIGKTSASACGPRRRLWRRSSSSCSGLASSA